MDMLPSPDDAEDRLTSADRPPMVTDVRAVAGALTHDSHSVNRHTRMVRNVALVLSSQVVIWIAGAGLAILLPRFVSDSDVGRLTFAASFTSVFTLIVLFGSERYLTREVARRPEAAPHLTFNALLTRFPLFAVSALLIGTFLVVFDYPRETVQIVGIFTASLFITGFGNTFTAVLQGHERMGIAALAAVIERVISGILGLAIIILAGKGMVAYATVLLGANAISVLLITIAFMKTVGLSWRFDLDLCKVMLRSGSPFFIWGLALFVYGSVDITMLSVMTSDSVVGWYGTAYRFVGIAGFFPFALTTALLPNIASMSAEHYRPLAQRCFDIVTFVSVPIAVFFVVGAQSIIDFLGYPSEYDNSVILLQILALHIPLVGFTMVGGTLLIASDKEGPRTKAAIAAAVLSPSLNLLLIPYFQTNHDNGAIGSAITTLFVEAFVVIAVFKLLERGTFNRANVMTTVRCSVAAVPMALAMYLAVPFGLPAVFAAGAASYLVAALATGAITTKDLLDVPAIAMGSRRRSTIEAVGAMDASSS